MTKDPPPTWWRSTQLAIGFRHASGEVFDVEIDRAHRVINPSFGWAHSEGPDGSWAVFFARRHRVSSTLSQFDNTQMLHHRWSSETVFWATSIAELESSLAPPGVMTDALAVTAGSLGSWRTNPCLRWLGCGSNGTLIAMSSTGPEDALSAQTASNACVRAELVDGQDL